MKRFSQQQIENIKAMAKGKPKENKTYEESPFSDDFFEVYDEHNNIPPEEPISSREYLADMHWNILNNFYK